MFSLVRARGNTKLQPEPLEQIMATLNKMGQVVVIALAKPCRALNVERKPKNVLCVIWLGSLASFRRGTGLFYRLTKGRSSTNKRQPPVPIPPRFNTHLRRWKTQEEDNFVKFKGKPLSSIKKRFWLMC